MTQIYPPLSKEKKPHQPEDGHTSAKHQAKPNGHSGMVKMAEKEVRFHTQSNPEAQEPPVEPFPGIVRGGLLAGILMGALVGLLIGALLFRNVFVISGWESLYSMGGFTFHVFWMLMGAAAGVLLIGVAAILMAPGMQAEKEQEEEKEEERKEDT